MNKLSVTIDDLKRLPLRAMVALAVRCARRAQPFCVPRENVEHGERLENAIENAIGDAIDIAESFVQGADPYMVYSVASSAATRVAVVAKTILWSKDTVSWHAAWVAEKAADAASWATIAASWTMAKSETGSPRVPVHEWTASKLADCSSLVVLLVNDAILFTNSVFWAKFASWSASGNIAERESSSNEARLSEFTNAVESVYKSIDACRSDYDKLITMNLGSFPDLGKPVNLGSDGPLGLIVTLENT